MSTVVKPTLEIATVSLLDPAVKNLAGYTGVLAYVSGLATPMTTPELVVNTPCLGLSVDFWDEGLQKS